MFSLLPIQGLYTHIKACEVVGLKRRGANDCKKKPSLGHGVSLRFSLSEIQLCVQQALQFLRPLSHKQCGHGTTYYYAFAHNR